jgi:hypothetical protein
MENICYYGQMSVEKRLIGHTQGIKQKDDQDGYKYCRQETARTYLLDLQQITDADAHQNYSSCSGHFCHSYITEPCPIQPDNRLIAPWYTRITTAENMTPTQGWMRKQSTRFHPARILSPASGNLR